MESLEETPFSQIYRAMRRDSPKGWVAIKRGSIDRKVAMQPHDIGKEERILLGLSSINVNVFSWFRLEIIKLIIPR